ncbi:MAG: uroporphyrinogen decarboxylase family protein [Rudaea sp.]
MNKRERIHAAIHREPVDRPPIALWRHFPKDDLNSEAFARRVVDFQNRYDFDLVKVTPAAGYMDEMYGAALEDAGNREGTRTHVTRTVKRWEDWSTIRELHADNPVFQRERESLRLIRRALGDDVPILQTIFSPLSTARNLAGDRLHDDLHKHPADVKHALEHLACTILNFAFDSLKAGADAIFFATQVATRDFLPEPESKAFGQAYNLTLLNELRGKANFVLLHAHGENIYFDHLAQYPVQIMNWHDRLTPPTLAEGKKKFHGAVAGGIDEWNVLARGTPEQVHAQVRDAIHETDGIGLLVAPGCVIPIDTPRENIRAAREAVE